MAIDMATTLQAPPPPEVGEPEVEQEAVAPMLPELVNNLEQREHTVQKLIDRWMDYKTFQDTEMRPMWEAMYKAYRGWKKQSREFRHTYTIREIWRQIEGMKAELAPQFFGGEQLFKYAPRHEEGEDAAAASTEIVHSQIDRQDMQGELMQAMDNAILYGTGYIHPCWHRYKRVNRKISSVHAPEETPWWKRTTTEVIEESPYLKSFAPWQVFTHHEIEDCRKSPCVYVLEVVSPNDLKTLIREGFLDRDLTKAAVEDESAGASQDALRSTMPPGSPQSATDDLLNGMDGDEPHEMLTCFTNDGMEYVILDQVHLVRSAPCPYGSIPMLAFRNTPQVGEHYGVPEPMSILDDQKIVDDVMALWVNTYHITSVPMFLVKKGLASKNWSTVNFKPGGKIDVENAEDVTPLPVNPTQMDLQAQAGFLLRNMKLTTGMTDELTGAGSAQKTATGVVRLQDAAGKRLAHKARLFMPVFRQAYKALHRLNSLYLNEEYAVRIEGEDGRYCFQKFGPEVFESDVDVQVELSNEMESGPEAANKWQMCYKLVGQDPMVERSEILLRMFRAMGMKRPRRALANPVTAQSDALKENQNLLAFGMMPYVKPSENHQVHAQILQMFMTTPEFMALPPGAQYIAQQHFAEHQAYVMQMQQAQAQAQQASLGGEAQPGPGSPVPEADARTEALFGNGMTGASEGGGPPPEMGAA